MDELTEVEIVGGLRKGDSLAWKALCDQYSRRIWAYVARLVGQDQSVVADVFQESLMAVARSGRNLNDSSRLWPWLAAIAHNQVALHWRKHHRCQTELLATEPISGELTPEETMLRQENSEQVRSILVEMSPEHVSVLEAKYMDDMSVAEIVAAFGGTTESVRSRLARARREFSKRIQSRSLVDE